MSVRNDWTQHLALCLVGAALVAWGTTAGWNDYRVPVTGVPALALVTAAHVPEAGRGPATKVVSYEYQTRAGDTRTGTVSFDAFSPVEVGMRIPIHYLASRPQVSRAAGDRGSARYHSVLVILGVALFGADGWLLFLGRKR